MENQPVLVTSRKVDHVARKYAFDENGEHIAMSDVASRVMLLVAFQVKSAKSVDPISRSTTAARIRAALAPLTSGRNAVAILKDVRVTNPAPATTLYEVDFVDLTRGDARQVETLGFEVSK